MDEDSLRALGGEIAQSLQAWSLQAGAAESFIFDHPFIGDAVSLFPGKLDQRRRRWRSCSPLLLLGGYLGIDRNGLHRPLTRVQQAFSGTTRSA